MDKNKILNHKKIAKNKRLSPNSKYLVGRYIREFKDQDLYIITDENGNAIDVVKGKDKANEMLAPLKKNQEYENKFNKIINKEESNTEKDKRKRQKLIDRYKSSGEAQRE